MSAMRSRPAPPSAAIESPTAACRPRKAKSARASRCSPAGQSDAVTEMAGPDKTPRHGQISGQRIGRPDAPGSKEWKYEGQHDHARHDPHPPPKSAKTDRGRGIQPFKRPCEASGHPLSVGLIASYLRATLADKT